MPRRRFLIFSFCNPVQFMAAKTVVPVGSHSNSSGPSTSKKHVNMILWALVNVRAFFRSGNEECRHSILMLLVTGSKWCHHVSSVAMIFQRNWFPISWYRVRCCMETDMRRLLLLCQMFWHPLRTNLAVLQPFTQYSVHTSYAHRNFLRYFESGDSPIYFQETVHICNCFLGDNHILLSQYCFIHSENPYTIEIRSMPYIFCIRR